MDMDIFEEITKHPILSSAVREIVYDISEIREMPYEEYFRALCKDAWTFVHNMSRDDDGRYPDRRIDGFVSMLEDHNYKTRDFRLRNPFEEDGPYMFDVRRRKLLH